MLGLDAVSLSFIRENLDDLPFLKSLLETGICRDLQSSAEFLQASVWPTFLSGKLPGEHGQHFPFQWSAQEHRYRRLADRHWSEIFDIEPFWHRVARAGLPTIAFDVGHALHDERAPFLQITNWSYQSSGAASASQPDVLKDIRRRFGHRPIGPEVPVPKTASQCAAMRDRLVAAVRAKADATLHLMQRPWNLFVTGWYEPHRAGHNLWPVEGDFASEAAPDAMLAVYQETDRQLARIWRELKVQAPDASFLLFCLHGMEPNRAQDHFLSEILSRLNGIYLGNGRSWTEQPTSHNAMTHLRQTLPPTLQYWMASILGEKVQDWVVNRALSGGRNWGRTPSVSVLSGGEGLVRFNLKGREANGYFEPGSQELNDYSTWLVSGLSAIRVGGTDQPLVKSIASTDDVFPGPRRKYLPDLMIKWAPEAPASRIWSPQIGEIKVSLATGRGGNHNAAAFMIATGDDRLRHGVASTSHIAQLAALAEGYLLDS